MNTDPAYWKRLALQQRRIAHHNRKTQRYTMHNWRIYFSLDMAEAIRIWKYYRELLKGKKA